MREVEGPRRCLPADAVRSFLTRKLKSHKLRPERKRRDPRFHGPFVEMVFRRPLRPHTAAEARRAVTRHQPSPDRGPRQLRCWGGEGLGYKKPKP